jgi:hypothetical protein
MIQLHGTLSVIRRKGARGSFSVGDLSTDIGEFKVKDQLLDQFEEGEYKGTFVVSRIYPSSYVWRGKVVAEIRATVTDVLIDAATEGAQHEAPEPDPIEEPRIEPEEVLPPARVVRPQTPADDAEYDEGDTPHPDLHLFGDELLRLIFAQQSVKLDPTVDRALFRDQRDRLKQLGYRFDAKTQAWTYQS